MPSLFEPLLAELEQEAEATRRFMERVPEDQLGWKPHDKSMSLGQLALHVASIPATIASFAATDSLDATNTNFTPAAAESVSQFLQTLAESVAKAKEVLASLNDSQALSDWTLTKSGEKKFTIPRIMMVRSLMLNHLYHHRGQLAVYFRLLEVPVPATYGRSADENPLGL